MATESIKTFYAGKNIFITGASGFLGICLLEKILRSIPDHGDIYLLLRPKKGKEIAERLEDIKKNKIFATLLKNCSGQEDKVFEKIKAIAGDVGQDNLGLSAADKKLITDNIHIIFHSAATLDFGDTLKATTDINLLGTRRVVQLAKECTKLKSLVHVSSAYVNSWKLQADEIIYPLPRDADELIDIVNKLSPEELEKRTPEILGDHPNTYTITKHMAEHEIQKVEEQIPCTIVRPSMIVGAWKDPVPGWTISKNGPQGFLMGASKGVIRRLPVAKELIYDYIPVDIVVNALLAAGFRAAVTQSKKVAVYHCTSSTRNPFQWCKIEDSINEYLHRYPLKSAVWYPRLKLLPSITWYKISSLFVHIIPALILDTVTRLSGGRPILLKLHRNVNASLDRLEKFIFTEWKFSAMRMMDLQDYLVSSDKDDFNLDISGLSWIDYFDSLTLGARVYLSNDAEKSLSSARTRDKILGVLHLLWKALIFSLLWWLFACITGLTMTKSVYILPVLYIIFSLL